jgi:hypothetical protein
MALLVPVLLGYYFLEVHCYLLGGMRICWLDSLFFQVVLTISLGLLELKDFMLVFFCSGMLATGVLCL